MTAINVVMTPERREKGNTDTGHVQRLSWVFCDIITARFGNATEPAVGNPGISIQGRVKSTVSYLEDFKSWFNGRLRRGAEVSGYLDVQIASSPSRMGTLGLLRQISS